MRQKGIYATGTFLVGLMFLGISPSHGQEPATTRSLGQVARQLKAQRKKERHKPVAVYTNDNLPSGRSLGMVSAEMEEGAQKKEQTTGKGAPSASASEEHGEKYFRSKAGKIRSQMEFHKRQLAVLKQQLGLARMQYYPDPQKTLEQESTPAFQTDEGKLRAQIANAEKAVADDQKAINNLQQELRRAGGDPGWIR
jgi:hypothetical protein